jgi:hypothetical protein
MHLAHRIMSSLLLTAALAAPVAIMAAPVPQRVGVQLRVYDRHHKDYHNWDDREESSYRRYLAGRRQTYRVYARQRRATQDRYWDWRHAHPDER